MEELIKKLHPHEKKILSVLNRLGMAKPDEIAKETGISVDAVRKACQWAAIKGLVKIEKEIKEEINLTDEGREYVEYGLPEKQLLLFLKDSGDLRIEDAIKNVKRSKIAIAWAKRKGWIDIKDGFVRITEKGMNALNSETEAEKVLKEGKGRRDVIDELTSRGLLNVKRTETGVVMLTQKGRDISANINDEEEIGQLTPEMIKTGSWKGKRFREYDISLPVPKVYVIKKHPYIQFLNYVRRKLIGLGFKEMTGPYVETEFWNCDALFMPQDHPARGIHDMFIIKNPNKGVVRDKGLMERVKLVHKSGWITGSKGWGYFDSEKSLNLILRSQTTAVSARTLYKNKEKPAMYFTIDRVFRPDVVDAKHLFEFHQAEGIVIDDNLTLKHLLGFLEVFGKEIVEAEKVRFRPSYFPFTEPSVEMDCMVDGKWMEIGGAGIFRPEVTLPLGVEETVLAWGIGITRLAMIKLGIKDLRELFTKDIDVLRNMKMVI